MYKSFSENTLAKIFLPVNLIVSVVIFNWTDFSAYLSKMGESGCKPVSTKLSFAIYDTAGSASDLTLLLVGVLVVFSFFYLPSYLATLVLSNLSF